MTVHELMTVHKNEIPNTEIDNMADLRRHMIGGAKKQDVEMDDNGDNDLQFDINMDMDDNEYQEDLENELENERENLENLENLENPENLEIDADDMDLDELAEFNIEGEVKFGQQTTIYKEVLKPAAEIVYSLEDQMTMLMDNLPDIPPQYRKTVSQTIVDMIRSTVVKLENPMLSENPVVYNYLNRIYNQKWLRPIINDVKEVYRMITDTDSNRGKRVPSEVDEYDDIREEMTMTNLQSIIDNRCRYKRDATLDYTIDQVDLDAVDKSLSNIGVTVFRRQGEAKSDKWRYSMRLRKAYTNVYTSINVYKQLNKPLTIYTPVVRTKTIMKTRGETVNVIGFNRSFKRGAQKMYTSFLDITPTLKNDFRHPLAIGFPPNSNEEVKKRLLMAIVPNVNNILELYKTPKVQGQVQAQGSGLSGLSNLQSVSDFMAKFGLEFNELPRTRLDNLVNILIRNHLNKQYGREPQYNSTDFQAQTRLVAYKNVFVDSSAGYYWMMTSCPDGGQFHESHLVCYYSQINQTLFPKGKKTAKDTNGAKAVKRLAPVFTWDSLHEPIVDGNNVYVWSDLRGDYIILGESDRAQFLEKTHRQLREYLGDWSELTKLCQRDYDKYSMLYNKLVLVKKEERRLSSVHGHSVDEGYVRISLRDQILDQYELRKKIDLGAAKRYLKSIYDNSVLYEDYYCDNLTGEKVCCRHEYEAFYGRDTSIFNDGTGYCHICGQYLDLMIEDNKIGFAGEEVDIHHGTGTIADQNREDQMASEVQEKKKAIDMKDLEAKLVVRFIPALWVRYAIECYGSVGSGLVIWNKLTGDDIVSIIDIYTRCLKYAPNAESDVKDVAFVNSVKDPMGEIYGDRIALLVMSIAFANDRKYHDSPDKARLQLSCDSVIASLSENINFQPPAGKQTVMSVSRWKVLPFRLAHIALMSENNRKTPIFVKMVSSKLQEIIDEITEDEVAIGYLYSVRKSEVAITGGFTSTEVASLINKNIAWRQNYLTYLFMKTESVAKDYIDQNFKGVSENKTCPARVIDYCLTVLTTPEEYLTSDRQVVIDRDLLYMTRYYKTGVQLVADRNAANIAKIDAKPLKAYTPLLPKVTTSSIRITKLTEQLPRHRIMSKPKVTQISWDEEEAEAEAEIGLSIDQPIVIVANEINVNLEELKTIGDYMPRATELHTRLDGDMASPCFKWNGDMTDMIHLRIDQECQSEAKRQLISYLHSFIYWLKAPLSVDIIMVNDKTVLLQKYGDDPAIEEWLHSVGLHSIDKIMRMDLASVKDYFWEFIVMAEPRTVPLESMGEGYWIRVAKWYNDYIKPLNVINATLYEEIDVYKMIYAVSYRRKKTTEEEDITRGAGGAGRVDRRELAGIARPEEAMFNLGGNLLVGGEQEEDGIDRNAMDNMEDY